MMASRKKLGIKIASGQQGKGVERGRQEDCVRRNAVKNIIVNTQKRALASSDPGSRLRLASSVPDGLAELNLLTG